MAGHRGSGEDAAAVEEARRRAAAIDRVMDLIPARFYLGSEIQQVKDARECLDPDKVKSTSALVAEVAAADAVASSSSKKGQKRKGRREAGDEGRPVASFSAANSRTELHQKLERRIEELKEERRRKQSEADKAKNAQARAEKAAPKGSAAEAAPAKRENGHSAETPEVRLSFEPRAAALPFEAGVGRRGRKVQKLRSDLRKREAEAERLRAAESAGEGREVRQELAMRKALLRAKGEKVHDDLGRLRKAQKALDLKKKKGKEKWAERKEHDLRQVKEQQEKRRENLQGRRSKKKEAGKKRAGFEGKSSGFLNSEK
mmetsp:Transcript_29261/g.78127  ORF Transcript_29261/g.78127 Transcript_29261/m.78127 type:complete len:316 (-) Transcript_29261:58-1005(-)